MSEVLSQIYAWPEGTLPLPFVDYSGSPRNATLVSDLKSANILRRSRFQRSYATLSVAWEMSPVQYTEFKTFFEGELSVGASSFRMNLRYPQNSQLEEWIVRFIGGYEATHVDGRWSVLARLDLIDKTTLPDGVGAFGWGQFFTAFGEESIWDDLYLVTSEGYHFWAKDPEGYDPFHTLADEALLTSDGRYYYVLEPV